MEQYVARAAAMVTMWTAVLGARLDSRDRERGDGPVDNAIIIGICVTAALVLGGLIKVAADKYGSAIK